MPHLLPLLAVTREELARSMREAFDRDSSAGNLLLVFVLALGLAMLWFYWRNRTVHAHETAAATPLHLFHELSRDLAIPLLDRWLLVRISREQLLPTPITLLVSPRTLRHHAAGYAQSLSPRRRARVLFRIAKLRRALFSA